jgi:hypothetical protein
MSKSKILIENLEKGRLLKEALKIVDKLANSDFADVDGDITLDDFDIEELQDLIIRARKLKQSRWWDVPRT